MNRRVIGLIGIGIAILVVLIIAFTKKANHETVSSTLAEPGNATEPKQGLDITAELASIQEKMASGDLLTAKNMADRLMESLTDPTQMELLDELKRDINYKLVFSTIDVPGKTEFYEVKPGDSLYKIARKYDVPYQFIKRINGLRSDVIKPGQKLRIWTEPLSVVVNKSRLTLTVYSGDEPIKVYKISVGKDDATPEGDFTITNKLVNPDYFSNGKKIPYGDPENILGTRWMGISHPNGSYGIHGTASPDTIGTYETQGCIRMSNEDVEELYDMLPRGAHIKIVK